MIASNLRSNNNVPVAVLQMNWDEESYEEKYLYNFFMQIPVKSLESKRALMRF